MSGVTLRVGTARGPARARPRGSNQVRQAGGERMKAWGRLNIAAAGDGRAPGGIKFLRIRRGSARCRGRAICSWSIPPGPSGHALLFYPGKTDARWFAYSFFSLWLWSATGCLRLQRTQCVLQHGNHALVFGTIRGLLADQNAFQRQHLEL